mgnify:FL=1
MKNENENENENEKDSLLDNEKTKKIPADPPKDCIRTPLMVINEISRMFLTAMNGGTLGDPPNRVQHSCRLILMYLARNNGATQRDLVHFSKMKAPTISIALKNMEADGLVERRADAKDQRKTCVFLTDKGREVDRANLERVHRLDHIVLNEIDANEQAALLSVLEKMRENLAKELNISDEIE